MDHHFVGPDVAMMDNNPLRFSPAQARAGGNGQMNRCRIRIGNSIDRECRFMRQGHGGGSTIRLRPEHGLSIGNAIYASRYS